MPMKTFDLKRRIGFFSVVLASALGIGVTRPRSAEAACIGTGNVCVTCTGATMCSQGGQVVANPRVYVIYWGWNSTNDPQGLMNVAANFVGNMSGTPYMNVMSQYGVGNSITTSLLAGTYFD